MSTPGGASVWDIDPIAPESVEQATPTMRRAPAPPADPLADIEPAPAAVVITSSVSTTTESRRQIPLPIDEPVEAAPPLLDEDRLERLERSLPTIATELVDELVPATPTAKPARPAVETHARRNRRPSTRSQRSVDPRLLIGLVVVLVIGGVALLFLRSGGDVASSAAADADATSGEVNDIDLPFDPDGLLEGSWNEEPESEAPAAADPVVDEIGEDTSSIAVAEPVEPAAEPIVAEEPVVTEEPEPADEAAVPVPTPPADGRVVELETRTEPCKFSNNCLIVGFTITGFDSTPAEFVCEFSSGARYTFDLPGSTVGTACTTGAIGDSITIEVDGVRSETIVHS